MSHSRATATKPARLTLVAKDGSDSSYFPVKNNFTLGRGYQCTLRILDSSVDPLHCSFDWFNSAPYITKHTSNGKLKVNGKNVNGQVILKDKDTIKVGDSITFRLDVDSPPSLLHDLVSPPRLCKPVLRQRTQNQRLASLTKPPQPVKAEALTPVKRQLFTEAAASNQTVLTDDDSESDDQPPPTPPVTRNRCKLQHKPILRPTYSTRVSKVTKKVHF